MSILLSSWTMNNNFNETLRKMTFLSPNSFSEALFENVGWKYFSEKKHDYEINVKNEKSEVLDSFTEFVQEQIENSDHGKLSFDGGEIVEKLTSTKLIETINKKVSEKNSEIRLSHKLNNPNLVKVMFVNDFLFSEFEDIELTDKFEIELLTSFRLETAQLFTKMIKAMKLSQEEFVISAVSVQHDEQQNNFLDELNQEIAFFQPELVITLGAVATQTLLQNKDRLAKIHGQIFTRSTTNNQQFNYKIMPLFHPELLLINPNMKKTAWIDMQKAMKELSIE